MITAVITGGEVQLTGNPVIINCSGASIPAGAYEYMITLRTISQDNKLPGAPFHDASTPDSNGNAVFDISGILDQPLEVTFQYPVTQKVIAHPTRAFNIQVQPGERYINSSGILVENWFAVSSVFQMIKGGLSPRQNAMMKAENKDFYSTYIQAGKFLTPRPWGDFIHPNQPVKLWFMPDANNLSTLAIAGYYSDFTIVQKETSVFLNTDYLYEFNLNPALHGISLQPSSSVKLLYFDVWLEYNGSILSDVRRFEVDWRYCERPYFLFFANSLGGIDDVYLSGFGIDSFGITGSQAYRPVRPTDTVFTPTILSSDKLGQNKWKINSGWKSISTIQFFRDLMLSKQAWFLYPNSGNTNSIIVPVIIQNSDVELFNRQEDQWNIDIEFIEAHTSRFSFDNRMY
jgi:hypothetical protein